LYNKEQKNKNLTESQPTSMGSKTRSLLYNAGLLVVFKLLALKFSNG